MSAGERSEDPDAGNHLRVAHVTPTFHPAHYYGGPAESVYQLCRHLATAGCDVRVLTTNAGGPAVLDVPTDRDMELAPRLRVRYAATVARTEWSPRLLLGLRAHVRWAEVVHLTAVYSFPTIPTLLACRLEGKPLVWSPRGALQRWASSRRPALKSVWETTCRLLAPPATRIHVTSIEERRETLLRFPRWDVSVFPNGVEVPSEVRHAGAEPELRIVYLGRLDPKKGIENLLLACRILEDSGAPRWRLAIAGSGTPPYEKSLTSLTSRLALDARVRWAGSVEGDAKRLLFESADVVVVPSHTENFGLVVVEALAHGVPVIASLGTPWQGLETNGCGLHVDNSPESLAGAIRRIADLPRAEMGARGREWIAREFEWSAIAREAVAVYRSTILARSRIGSA